MTLEYKVDERANLVMSLEVLDGNQEGTLENAGEQTEEED